jgi:hypothetical protein
MKRSGSDLKGCKSDTEVKDSVLTLANEPALELPDDTGLPVDPKPLSLEEHLALCEQMLPIWNKERYEFPERSCPVSEPFVFK